ncbi:MAG: hypothetical protein ACK4NS_13820, partial [Saprospiraceae bacterium]
YQLTRDGNDVGAPVAGTGMPLSFGLQTIPGEYNAYSVNPTTGCENLVEGPVFVEVEPTPAVFNVTGGGAYCDPPGGGVPVGLSGSESGVTYQLRLNGVDVGLPVAGTGSPLDFGTQTAAGVYTVVASSASGDCTADMTGSATVIVNSGPTLAGVLTQPTTCVSTDGAIALTISGAMGP